MSCVPDFVDKGTIGTIVVAVGSYLVLSYIPFVVEGGKRKEQQVPVSLLGIMSVMILAGSVGARSLISAAYLGILLAACETDCRSREVYNLLWLVAGLIWLLAWLLTTPLQLVEGGNAHWILLIGQALNKFPWEPIVFGLLQQLLFTRFYGRADCHAFSCCGFYLWLRGEGLSTYLLQMLLALVLLAVVQLFRKNINSHGNLKKEVAFLPYITVSFWVLVLF